MVSLGLIAIIQYVVVIIFSRDLYLTFGDIKFKKSYWNKLCEVMCHFMIWTGWGGGGGEQISVTKIFTRKSHLSKELS